jgi:hypothetical protein
VRREEKREKRRGEMRCVEQSEVERTEEKRGGREQGKVHDVGERRSEVEGRVQGMVQVR